MSLRESMKRLEDARNACGGEDVEELHVMESGVCEE